MYNIAQQSLYKNISCIQERSYLKYEEMCCALNTRSLFLQLSSAWTRSIMQIRPKELPKHEHALHIHSPILTYKQLMDNILSKDNRCNLEILGVSQRKFKCFKAPLKPIGLKWLIMSDGLKYCVLPSNKSSLEQLILLPDSEIEKALSSIWRKLVVVKRH